MGSKDQDTQIWFDWLEFTCSHVFDIVPLEFAECMDIMKNILVENSEIWPTGYAREEIMRSDPKTGSLDFHVELSHEQTLYTAELNKCKQWQFSSSCPE